MSTLTWIAGVAALLVVLFDAFQTIILPRRAVGRFRITKLFYALTWRPWVIAVQLAHNARRHETLYSYYGPLSLIMLLMVWAGGLIVGFALLFSALGSPLHDPSQMANFRSDLYMSGTTLFTLGLGDVTPHSPAVRALVILESGTGLGFLAAVMGYFPVLYGAFSRREVSIALLDARAGSPPTAAELLRRHSHVGAEEALGLLLTEWERWSAELLESHISYPLLCYFRSQHNNQSWLSALTAILDTSALMIAGVRGHEARQAQLTFIMARHALIDLSQVLSLEPLTGTADRLPRERYEELYNRLCQSGVSVCRDDNSYERLRELRTLYEAHAEALAAYLHMSLPPWIPEKPRVDNWERISKLRVQSEAEDAPASTLHGQAAATLLEPHHDF